MTPEQLNDVVVTDEMVVRAARSMEPELFCGDPEREHLAASPLLVEVVKLRVLSKARAALQSALSTDDRAGEARRIKEYLSKPYDGGSDGHGS